LTTHRPIRLRSRVASILVPGVSTMTSDPRSSRQDHRLKSPSLTIFNQEFL
jgi:hypothetical protein